MNKRLEHLQPMPGRSYLLIQFGQPAKYYYNDEELVFIDRQIFHEVDMRFRFKDIQTVWISPSRHFIFTTIFLLAFLVGFIVVTFFIADNNLEFGMYFGGIGLVLLLALLGLHYALGPSCRLTLQTRAHRVRLRSIHRRRHAQRFMETLLPKIQAAQHDMARPEPNAEQGAHTDLVPMQDTPLEAPSGLHGG